MRNTEKKESHYLSDGNITMSNALIKASHSLTLQEKRIICACIAKNDSRLGAKRDAHLSPVLKEMRFKITAQDYHALFGVDINNCYKVLKKSSKSLMTKHFSMKKEVKGKERIVDYAWLGYAEYAEEEGFIEIGFSQYAYPHLNALTNLFTTYKLRNAQSFRSMYTWRIYELLQSWKHTKSLNIHLDDLRLALDIPKSYKWIHIKNRALDSSIKELKEKSGIILDYTTFKTGRKITSLKFTWDKTL